jgi:hypothetical protein
LVVASEMSRKPRAGWPYSPKEPGCGVAVDGASLEQSAQIKAQRPVKPAWTVQPPSQPILVS